MSRIRVLVLGQDSLIGSHLFSSLANSSLNLEIFGTSRRTAHKSQVIFWNADNFPTNFFKHYDSVIVCFRYGINERGDAITDIHYKNLSFWRKVLEEVPESTQIIFPSSSRVFNLSVAERSSNAKPRPSDSYGHEKAEIEKLLSQKKNTSVVRLGKILHPKLKIFSEWIYGAHKGSSVKAFRNYFISPISLEDVTNAMLLCLKTPTIKILHVSPVYAVNYVDVARAFLRINFMRELVTPISYKNQDLLFNDTLEMDSLMEETLPKNWLEFTNRYESEFRITDCPLEI